MKQDINEFLSLIDVAKISAGNIRELNIEHEHEKNYKNGTPYKLKAFKDFPAKVFGEIKPIGLPRQDQLPYFQATLREMPDHV